MLKFYILISSDIGALFRHFSPHYSLGLTRENTEVVINTLDKEFERDAVHFCETFEICYHVTESNGTPAKGKNSLLEIFEKSDNDYCVQIDGDDYLTPHGVWLYQTIADSEGTPDVICLKNQIAMSRIGKMFTENSKKAVTKFFTVNPQNVNYDKLRKNMQSLHIPEYKIKDFIEYHKTYYETQGKYCEDEEAHSRVVFMSKKAAKYRFPEEFVVGEDTLFYYLLKDAHFRGELFATCNDEAPATYVYNQLGSGGTVWNHSNGFTNWDWMNTFNRKVEEMEKEGLLHEEDLPLIKLFYPVEGVIINDLGTAGLCRYEREDKYIELPANASEECVDAFLKEFGKSIEK